MVTSFHDEMKGTVQYDGLYSEAFLIQSGVKQGCVLASHRVLLCSYTLQHLFLPAAAPCLQSVRRWCLHPHQERWQPFQPCTSARKTKVRRVLIREMLFADDAALTAHTKDALQRLISSFTRASDEFGLTISLKKSNVMGQDVSSTPCISFGHHTLETEEDFTYLGSTISSNLSLDNELNTRIGKASIAMARLTKRV